MSIFSSDVSIKKKKDFMCLKIQACIKRLPRCCLKDFKMLYVIKVHCVLNFVLLFISKSSLVWNS